MIEDEADNHSLRSGLVLQDDDTTDFPGDPAAIVPVPVRTVEITDVDLGAASEDPVNYDRISFWLQPQEDPSGKTIGVC
jgi:hypothetical protein